MNGVGTRIATGLVLAPLAALAVLFLPPVAFSGLVSVVMLAGFWEWTRLSGLPGRPMRVAALLALAAVFVLLALLPRAALPIVASTACVFWAGALFWLMNAGFAARDTWTSRLLKMLAGAILLCGAWAGAVFIRDGLPNGAYWLIACLTVIFGGDTLAYFTGRAFGQRKLAPSISPGKTWAGLYGAVGGAIVVALAAGWLLGLRDARLGLWLGLAALCLLLSIVGDLFESLMKRHRQVKDSGRLFPGHGGVLDRGDSLFAALPAFAVGLAWMLA